jgi:transketolase
MAFTLWHRHLKHNPRNPKWFDRDRFVLSAGHGSMLLYSLLHLTGYDLPLSELQNFRQWGSMTPGHPENHLTPGVEMATGPLGQGFATGVGMAIAERFLGARYNRPGHEVVDHFTYAIVSDGDLMEGVACEAASLAGHLGLGKLIYLYDDNGITIDGTTDITFTEDVEARFASYGWHVQKVDGMNPAAVNRAISEARLETDRPSLIVAKTTIGFGSPNKAGTNKVHGSPLGPEELKLTKAALGLPPDCAFYVPEEALSVYRRAIADGERLEAEWEAKMDAYAKAFPAEAAELQAAIAGDLGDAWKDALPSFGEKMATRKAGKLVLEAIAPHLPNLLLGSADLGESTFTVLHGAPDQQKSTPEGRNVNYGIREHAMAAAVNGANLHGGTRALGSTFLIFSDYCRPSIRLAALMECPSLFVFTHDSIGLGEDGPTHQPVEHLASLRAIPNLNVFRPCDGNETSVGYLVALESDRTPTVLALTRQDVPSISPADIRNHPAAKGGYVLSEAEGTLQAVIVATGSEVSLALEAQARLKEDGISVRVVSLPSWYLFERQSAEYRQSVLPKGIPTVSVEAGTTFGWARYADAHVGLDRFGASAPASVLFREFGFTPDHVAAQVKALLSARTTA